MPDNLYMQGSPVIIEKAELYKSNTTGISVLVRIRNIASNRVRKAELCIWSYDAAGNMLGDYTQYKFSGIDVSRGDAFGDGVAIKLPDVNTAAIYVSVSEVAFDNKSVWQNYSEPKWEALPKQELVREKYSSNQKAAFAAKFGKVGEFAPKKHLDLTLCTCGMPNRSIESRCSKCRCTLTGMAEITDGELERDGVYYGAVEAVKTADIPTLQKCKAIFDSLGDYKDSKARAKDCVRKVKLIEDEHKKVSAENRARRKRLTTIFSIASAVAAILLVGILSTVFIIIPSAKYNEALSMMEVGNFDEARIAFREIEAYYDCKQKLNMIWGVDKLEDWEYDKAIKAILESGEPVRIVLDTDGGDAQNETNKVYLAEQEFLSLSVAEKTGYVFDGWELLRCEYDRNDCLKLTFKAKWNGTYAIKYNLGGGKTKNPDTYDKDGEDIVLEEPTKKGYTFIGWTGEGIEEPTLSVTIKSGSYGDLEYTANWEPAKYTVVLDPKGGMCDKEYIVVEYGKIYSLPKPEREGYIFLNWTDSKGNNYNGGVWSRDYDVTLTAKWAKIGR